MKKIFLLLTVFSMVFTSCEPLEDINAEVDAQVIPIVGDVIFTMTEDDYAELGDTSTLAEPAVVEDLISNRVK